MEANIKKGYKQTDVGIIPEDWKAEKIENVAPLQRGFDLPNRELRKGNFPVVYSNGILNFHSEYKAKAPGVVTGRSGTIGKVNFIEQDYFPHNTSLWVTDFKGNNPKFIYYLYKSVKLERFGTGSGVPTLNRNDVHLHKIPLPPLPEQQAIAEVLSDVDALVTSLDQLITKKRNIKQGAMQLLLTGKKRLPGFSGDWETKTLGEICEKYTNGGTPPTQKTEYWKGTIPWITGADIVDQKVTEIRRFITKEAVKNSSTNVIEKGNLLLVTRTGVGKMTIAPSDTAISQDITGVYAKEKVLCIDYLFRYLDFNSTKLQSLNQGTSIAGITRETLTNTEIFLPPTTEEQKAIAQILSDMDAEIEALETRQAKYKAVKQGMMQELLTGKTRLNVEPKI